MNVRNDIMTLIVDDNEIVRKTIRAVLKDFNLTKFIEAEDGEQALGILNEEEIDLVIADLQMPKMNGLQLLKRIRSSSDLADIPFVMVTSSNEKNDIIEAVNAQVSQYIVKPFTSEVIYGKLKAVLKQHGYL
jgi:two-component system chemotaxis response regulator CheY